MFGMEVRTAAATALATHSCVATPRQSAAPASYACIANTRIWSAVGFAAVRVPDRAAAAHSHLCPAFHALISSNREKECGLVRDSNGEAFARVSVCLSVCVCVHARAHVHMCTSHTPHSLTQSSPVLVCV